MAKTSKIVTGTVVNVTLSNPGRSDGGVSPLRDPEPPPPLAVSPINEFVLSTIGGVMTIPARDIGKVTGGVPATVETEIVGRVPGSSIGDPPRMLCSFQAAWFGRVNGQAVTDPVTALFRAARAGRLVRLYGPLDRPDCQGLVWKLEEPTFDEAGMRGDGKLNHAPVTVNLSQWTPLQAIGGGLLGSAESRARDRIKAAAQGAQPNLNTDYTGVKF